MTTQLALDSAHDLTKPESGGVGRLDTGNYTLQTIKCRLLTSLGEWRLNSDLGWLGIPDYERNPDLFDIQLRAESIILSTVGVNSVESIDLKLEGRVLHLTFKAATIYGIVNLSIPWEL